MLSVCDELVLILSFTFFVTRPHIDMSHIDIVLVQHDDEVDRVTVRGEPGFTALTPFGSVRDIVEQELGVPQADQFFWLPSGATLHLPNDAMLQDGDIGHGCTIFVAFRGDVRSSASSSTYLAPSGPPKSAAVLRLERALSDLEPSAIEKRADELLQKWEAIMAVV